MHVYLNFYNKFILSILQNVAKFVWIMKQLSFSLFDFVIFYWLNLKKIEVALSKTKTFIAALKFQYSYLKFGVFLLQNCLTTWNIFLLEC